MECVIFCEAYTGLVVVSRPLFGQNADTRQEPRRPTLSVRHNKPVRQSLAEYILPRYKIYD
jgi:hypothetical protein